MTPGAWINKKRDLYLGFRKGKTPLVAAEIDGVAGLS